jgi:hypothetical protein
VSDFGDTPSLVSGCETPTELRIDVDLDARSVRVSPGVRDHFARWLRIYGDTDELVKRGFRTGYRMTRDRAVDLLTFLRFVAALVARRSSDTDDGEPFTATDGDRPLRWLDELTRLATTLTAAPVAPPAAIAVR